MPPFEVLGPVIGLGAAAISSGLTLFAGHLLTTRRQRIAHEQELVKMAIEWFDRWVRGTYLLQMLAEAKLATELARFAERKNNPPPQVEDIERVFWALAIYLSQWYDHSKNWGGTYYFPDLTAERIAETLDDLIIAEIRNLGPSGFQWQMVMEETKPDELLPTFRPKIRGGGRLRKAFDKFKVSASDKDFSRLRDYALSHSIILNHQIIITYSVWYGSKTPWLDEQYLPVVRGVLKSMVGKRPGPTQAQLETYYEDLARSAIARTRRWHPHFSLRLLGLQIFDDDLSSLRWVGGP